MEWLTDPNVFNYVVMPLLIFLARISDVSIGTIRIISIGKGNKALAVLLGFFEVLIWLVAIRTIMVNSTNVFYYVAYAGGFAAGTFVGMFIEQKLAIGVILIRIVTKKSASNLIKFLKSVGYSVTSLDAQSAKGRVHVIYAVVKRHRVKEVVGIINQFNPKAFYSMADVRIVRDGDVPIIPRRKKIRTALVRWHRKGK